MPEHTSDESAHDPDRLGKTGGRPRGGAGLTRLLGKSLGKGWQRQGKGDGRQRAASRGFKQRVVVKVLVVKRGQRQGGGKTRGGASLSRHVRYLGRDGTSEQGKRGQFYDRVQEGLDAAKLTKDWHDDRHHFRMIVSPEKGSELPDLKAYVREVMGRVERDLCPSPEERLEWLAINHFNTDNPHAHVLVRGVRERVAEREDGRSREVSPDASERVSPTRGRVLVLAREYVSHGLRGRAEDVATEVLGERSLDEVRRAREGEVTAERWTSLDRSIGRQAELQRGPEAIAGDTRIDVAPERLQKVSGHERGLLVRRLQTLERYGLARAGRGSTWHIAADARERLLALAARRDVIQQLYGRHGLEGAARVVPYGLAERLAGRVPEPLAGRVVDHGAIDEMTLDRYLVIQDGKGVRHFAKVSEGPAYERVSEGTLVELGVSAHGRATAAATLAEVAAAHPDRTYSERTHAAFLAQRSDRPDAEQNAVVKDVARHAEALAERLDSGVERTGDGSAAKGYRIDPEKLAEHMRRTARRATTDLRVVADGRPIEPSADRFKVDGTAPPARRSERGRGRDDRDEAERGHR